MIQIDTITQFYYENETIQMPKSFDYMGQVGATYVYGAGSNGREVEYKQHSEFGWGWIVTAIDMEGIENCCK